MMITKRGDLDVGASPEQVARLATMEPGKTSERKAWYLKQHTHIPYITVSTDPTCRGDWGEDEVLNRHTQND